MPLFCYFVYSAETLTVMEVVGSVTAVVNFNSVAVLCFSKLYILFSHVYLSEEFRKKFSLWEVVIFFLF